MSYDVPRISVTRIGHANVQPPRECRLLLRGGAEGQPLARFRAYCNVCDDQIGLGEQYIMDDYSNIYCVACVDWVE